MNPSTAMATVLVDELVRRGVRHAVLCPGSRSAPLAYALQLADRAGRLTLHVRVDERSAGFLALGLAKLTRVPAVVVTTSGTAVANLHPAVLEAHHAVVPLVVLSADRPVELRGTGANQTTTQPGMYAGAVRWSCDLAAPVREEGEVDRWRAAVRDAMDHAQGTSQDVAEPGPAMDHARGATQDAAEPGPVHLNVQGTTQDAAEPGPVHLNVQLREPLVPTDGAAWPQDLTAVPTSDADAPGHPAGPPALHPDETAGGGDVAAEPRTLVVVGDLPDPRQFRQVLTWARSHGWPVVAEPFGTHPRAGVTPHAPLVLSSQAWLEAHGPARVVTVGRVTLSRPVAALLRRPGVRLEVVRTHRWIESAATVVKVWEPEVLGRLGDHDGATEQDGTTWAAAWEAAGRAVGVALSAELSSTGAEADDDGRALRSTDVAEVLWREVPPGATLFVGSSNTVRDLDLTSGGRGRALTVAANRGLAGIDGCVSTAVGVALAGEGPTYAWMGDLTFLHDANGLLLGPLEPRPDLTIVVTNDDGGGIFTLLEPGEPERAADFERIFGTPTGTDLRALCAAHGVVHHRVTTGQELAAAVSRRPRGLTVVEVPVNREQHRRRHAAMRELARTVLG